MSWLLVVSKFESSISFDSATNYRLETEVCLCSEKLFQAKERDRKSVRTLALWGLPISILAGGLSGCLVVQLRLDIKRFCGWHQQRDTSVKGAAAGDVILRLTQTH